MEASAAAAARKTRYRCASAAAARRGFIAVLKRRWKIEAGKDLAQRRKRRAETFDARAQRDARALGRRPHRELVEKAGLPQAKLRLGATVADLGCGYGSSTILMAQAYRMSRFLGYDYHAASIESAREAAKRAGVADRVSFEVASAEAMPPEQFDLICCFDCVHDMGDPVGVLANVRRGLKPNGTLMIVEPYAGDALEDNLTPVGRIFYGASTMLCTPASLAQDVGAGDGRPGGRAGDAQGRHRGWFFALPAGHPRPRSISSTKPVRKASAGGRPADGAGLLATMAGYGSL
ncbi:MAG: class I SAM-dependent methyltransferase [Candidatus Cybelea sp.]